MTTIAKLRQYNALWLGIGVIILTAFLLAGCSSLPPPPPTQLSPICEALIGPIKYNTYNKKSTRFAGTALAPDLKQRNQVGVNLHCPQY